MMVTCKHVWATRDYCLVRSGHIHRNGAVFQTQSLVLAPALGQDKGNNCMPEQLVSLRAANITLDRYWSWLIKAASKP